jgi:hypothetical protein
LLSGGVASGKRSSSTSAIPLTDARKFRHDQWPGCRRRSPN